MTIVLNGCKNDKPLNLVSKTDGQALTLIAPAKKLHLKMMYRLLHIFANIID